MPTPKKSRKRKCGRHCRTVGCPGVVKQIKRKTHQDHFRRRFVCKLCGLRWTSIERDLPNSISSDGPHGTRAAERRLAEWQHKQASGIGNQGSAETKSPPVYPSSRDLFSSLN